MTTPIHGKPTEGMCCLCTMEDITEENGNYVEYQTYPSLTWHPCGYERSTVEHLLKTQFGAYLERVKTTNCQAELRRLLRDGPPVWLTDPHALKLPGAGEDKETTTITEATTTTPATDTHVCSLWYAGDNTVVSAKLNGAVEGGDRENLWNELKEFLVEEGKEPGDDDDNN
ncbi:unnamed protein product [Pseudo-nitzschia multistriata]|uniref:Uncharacterized protein n=1 Tax=Pseudo-nitzschia multistriata TaxID=183589 RepID=A0A448YXB5_9STRA|nr:unnamed protein product [Pseudo-nitzschia multistriata]